MEENKRLRELDELLGNFRSFARGKGLNPENMQEFGMIQDYLEKGIRMNNRAKQPAPPKPFVFSEWLENE